jgi:hypothetical protein
MRAFITTLITGFALIAAASTASAQSLAGQEGYVRQKAFLSLYEPGTCSKQWKQYMAASGHSAYITTPAFARQVLCTTWLNGRSRQEAERLGLAHCTKLTKYYKGQFIKSCSVAASK